MKPPAFQFYATDFLAGTVHMSATEVGIYIRLLCHQWDKGGLPSDERELLRLAQVRSVVPRRVMEKFPRCADGKLRNARLEEERTKQLAYRTTKAAAGYAGGKASGERRRAEANAKQNGSSASVLLEANAKQNEAFQSPSPSPEGTGVMRAREPDSESTPPTLEQWLTNAAFIGYDRTEAETAWHSLESMGWEKDGQPIQKWRHTQTVYRNRLAERREKERQRGSFSPGYVKRRPRGPNI